MKTLITVITFFTLSNAFASEPSLPELYFSYGRLYDGVVCEQTPVKPEWVKELRSKMGQIDELWTQKGTVLFKVLFDHTGLGFSRKEMDATFSLCPGKSSFSSPLVLNVTTFLDSFMGPKKAWSDDELVDLIFHELTHTWVVENLENSQLLIKYKDELGVVKSHLHLLAIQQFVYLKMDRPDLVELLAKKMKRIGGAYARSWEIVQTEGYQNFMNEFPVKQKE